MKLLALLYFLALPVMAVPADPLSGESRAQTAQPETSAADRFGSVFSRWRSGEDDAEAEVRSIADELLTKENRADPLKVVEHYAALTKAQRMEGFTLEARVLELREQLMKAHAKSSGWDAARGPIEEGIQSAVSDSIGMADQGARAKALSLRAEYCISCLEDGVRPEDRERLSDLVEEDAQAAIDGFASFDILRSALIVQRTLARIAQFRGAFRLSRTRYVTLATNAAAIHDTKKIVEATEGMLAIANERGDEIERRSCLATLARLGDASHDWPLARTWAMRLIHEDRAREALDFLDHFQIPNKNDPTPDAIDTRRAFAYVRALGLLRLGEFQEARIACVEARSLDDRLRAGSPDPRGDDFEQRFLEARIDLADGRPDAAIAHLSTAPFPSKPKARDEGALETLLGEAQLALGDANQARQHLERALALAEQRRRVSLNEPLVTDDEARRFNVVGEWEGAGLETVALLAKTLLALDDPLAAALASENWQSRTLRGDNEDSNELRARAGLKPVESTLTAEHLLAWAGTAELGLVTWVLGSDTSAVIHVKRTPSGTLDAVGELIPLPRAVLREGVRRLREAAIEDQDVSALATEIRDTLLPAKVLAHIGKPNSKSDRLLLLLHGPLEALPFELLGLGEQTFDEELSLSTLPGLPALEPGVPLAAKAFERWQLLGSPVDGADLDGTTTILLRGADAELRLLSRSYPRATLAVGGNFRRSGLERALRSGECVHIATHFEAKPGEERSRFPAAGLRLCDGDVASARDIADLEPNLPLVVLSACESGGGRDSDGEGLFGVSRAFLEGGTRNLVVTLWPIADDAAQEFAVAFHAALKAGNRPSEATRIARLHLRSAEQPTREWAAFRFLGRD